MSNVHPIFARLESDFAEAMAQPIRTDIPRPADPFEPAEKEPTQ